MFSSKERSTLRSIAQNIEPITQIGKGGISENLIASLSEALDAREIIKVSTLNNADSDAKAYAEELSTKLNAEVICVIGRKIVLYRYSNKKGIKHIEY